MKKPIVTVYGEVLIKKGTREEAEAIAKFARRPVWWGELLIEQV